MTRCTRCNRKLKEPSPTGLGPVCRVAVLGPPPKASKQSTRRRNVSKDEITLDMFAYWVAA